MFGPFVKKRKKKNGRFEFSSPNYKIKIKNFIVG